MQVKNFYARTKHGLNLRSDSIIPSVTKPEWIVLVSIQALHIPTVLSADLVKLLSDLSQWTNLHRLHQDLKNIAIF